MVSDTVKLQLSEALMIYGMGFSIQIATYKDNVENITELQENNINNCTLDEYLYNHKIWDQDHNFLRKAKFYATSKTFDHAGLHVMFDDGRPNIIENGKIVDIRKKLQEIEKDYTLDDMYVQRNILHVQAKAKA